MVARFQIRATIAERMCAQSVLVCPIHAESLVETFSSQRYSNNSSRVLWPS